MDHDDDTIAELLAAIDDHESDCTSNEADFVERCLQQYDAEGSLSDRNIDRLQRILDKLERRR